MEFDAVNAADYDKMIDGAKLQRLKTRIYVIERENYKTKKLKDNEVVDKIVKIIIQEIENVN